eukprot:1143193-Pelagomonas_calceolata.AAC.2
MKLKWHLRCKGCNEELTCQLCFQVDTGRALYSVLQQCFVGDEQAAVKRLAAEAAILAKLHGREAATVSKRSLKKILEAAGVQSEQLMPSLSEDSAAFCVGSYQVQLQPAFQQQLLTRIAEQTSYPLHNIAPCPPKEHAAAMESWMVTLKGICTRRKQPSISTHLEPVAKPLPAPADLQVKFSGLLTGEHGVAVLGAQLAPNY